MFHLCQVQGFLCMILRETIFDQVPSFCPVIEIRAFNVTLKTLRTWHATVVLSAAADDITKMTSCVLWLFGYISAQ